MTDGDKKLYYLVSLPNGDDVLCEGSQLEDTIEMIVDQEGEGYAVSVVGVWMTKEEFEDVGEY